MRLAWSGGASSGGGGFVHRFEDFAGAFEQDLACGQKLHAAGRAGEEGGAELVFEASDVPADGRLRDAQAAGGFAHVLLFSHGHEVANLREAHRQRVPHEAQGGKREIETVLALASGSL